ncbi:MAG: glycosyltransferase family 2 protein [Filimonas sp.]|nr:glycosyltransferase family 2 protein [Filimonas sp.]
MSFQLPITVVIPTYKRTNSLVKTLKNIYECNPLPAEVIIHIDNGDDVTERTIKTTFSSVKIVKSNITQGPGGGRNKAITEASNDLIASFDDDSYPAHIDYFERLYKVFNLFPDAAVIESRIFHQNEHKPESEYQFWRCYLFTGCGVAYRKKKFLTIGGYVPTAVAYGLEEVDFSMRAFAYEEKFVRTSWLTVFHDTQLVHHQSAEINSGYITNLGVLVYLRYPQVMWFYGGLQVLNRVAWAIAHKRFRGLLPGLMQIPSKSKSLKKYKRVLPAKTIKRFLKVRASQELHYL